MPNKEVTDFMAVEFDGDGKMGGLFRESGGLLKSNLCSPNLGNGIVKSQGGVLAGYHFAKEGCLKSPAGEAPLRDRRAGQSPPRPK
jgi:hypothetical protein